MEKPDDIVGRRTFITGPVGISGSTRSEPLTRADAEALMASVEKVQRERNERMPDEKAAIKALFDAWLRLKDFGWNQPQYCPKDGTHFHIIELGSTGIFEGAYVGKWPDGRWDSWDEHDMYCSSIAPAMFKLFPADEEKRKQRMADAAAKFKAESR